MRDTTTTTAWLFVRGKAVPDKAGELLAILVQPARFSPGICPDCWREVVVPQMREAGIDEPEKETL